MHDYARHLIASTAAQVLPCRDNAIKAAIARQFLPYCLSPRSDGRAILLNREHKPLGWPTRLSCFVDYDSPEFSSMVVDLPPAFAEYAPRATTEHGTFLYLYGRVAGDDPPWSSTDAAWLYLGKLRALLDTDSITREGCQP